MCVYGGALACAQIGTFFCVMMLVVEAAGCVLVPGTLGGTFLELGSIFRWCGWFHVAFMDFSSYISGAVGGA